MSRGALLLLAGCVALAGLDCGFGIAGIEGGSGPRDPSKLVRPEHDFEYLGAFRFPEGSGGTSWGYGGDGMTYRPDGDPEGPDDGHPGSLFAIGHRHKNFVSEIAIPKPSKSPDVADLPVARTLQPFTDVSGGIQIQRLTGRQIADVEYHRGRLFWVLFEYYMPQIEMPTFGWASPDFRRVDPHGPWRIGRFASAATSKYLFEIPADWADRHASGHRIAAGRSRLVNRGSWGPALYAVAPWLGDEPPAKGARIEAIELLRYPDKGSRVKDYSNADNWRDGAWITVGAKSAVLIAGTKAERSLDSGLQYYGPPGPHGCGSKGYHAEPYYAAMLFYDPRDLAAAAGGLWASRPQPYATLQVQNRMRRKCNPILGGVGYDRERGLLYVLEIETEGGTARRPLGHVWRIRDAGLPPDVTPPATPGGLRAEARRRGRVVLRWKPSTDDVGRVIYVVYRDDEPIAITKEPEYEDEKAKGGRPYRYRVEARDAVNNRSAPSAEVSAASS